MSRLMQFIILTKYIPAHKAEELLRVAFFLVPDKSNGEQEKQMIKKTTFLGEMVQTEYVNQKESWIAPTATALKSIEYVLPALMKQIIHALK